MLIQTINWWLYYILWEASISYNCMSSQFPPMHSAFKDNHGTVVTKCLLKLQFCFEVGGALPICDLCFHASSLPCLHTFWHACHPYIFLRKTRHLNKCLAYLWWSYTTSLSIAYIVHRRHTSIERVLTQIAWYISDSRWWSAVSTSHTPKLNFQG